jgi:hypothetical protein
MSPQLSEITERPIYSPVDPNRLAMPEFVDVQGARLYFGIRQSLLYRLLSEGKISGVSIRRRGKTRGRRLFSCESIRAFLATQIDRPGVTDPDRPGVTDPPRPRQPRAKASRKERSSAQ